MVTQKSTNKSTDKSTDKSIRIIPQYILPQRLLTRFTYRLTRIRTPWLKNYLIRRFIHHFKVDMNEALQPDAAAYEHFNAFFTRVLKPEKRPVASAASELCCPVDGRVSQAGVIKQSSIFQAKGHRYTLQQLLGGDEQQARLFHNGSFATLYLSPRDYHRIHMPLTGVLKEMVHIPGKLFSVSPFTTQSIPRLFARNERVVNIFDTDCGAMALILVGAINVASIETVWAGAITPPLATKISRRAYPDSGDTRIMLEQGAEMGRFNMGSTVILLFAENKIQWHESIQPDALIRFGQKLAEKIQ